MFGVIPYPLTVSTFQYLYLHGKWDCVPFEQNPYLVYLRLLS